MDPVNQRCARTSNGDIYRQMRVNIADQRIEVSREMPLVASINKWSANVPGTTYLLPIAELSALYINVLLSAFDRGFADWIRIFTSANAVEQIEMLTIFWRNQAR